MPTAAVLLKIEHGVNPGHQDLEKSTAKDITRIDFLSFKVIFKRKRESGNFAESRLGERSEKSERETFRLMLRHLGWRAFDDPTGSR